MIDSYSTLKGTQLRNVITKTIGDLFDNEVIRANLTNEYLVEYLYEHTAESKNSMQDRVEAFVRKYQISATFEVSTSCSETGEVARGVV